MWREVLAAIDGPDKANPQQRAIELPSRCATVRGIQPMKTMSDKKPKTHYVLYDSGCPLCTFQMRVLTWLDWFNVISLLPISSDKAAEIAPTLTREDLLEAIHCVTPRGDIHRGARCIRFVGMRMPLLIPLSLILWFPGIIWFAEKFYMWISRNRYRLSKIFGCKGACAVMPARKRENEQDASVPLETNAPASKNAS
ncbi:MAG: putative DCC family thiol-disulfide oxidoreductase YuxK [Limisphaerales bacterium]